MRLQPLRPANGTDPTCDMQATDSEQLVNALARADSSSPFLRMQGERWPAVRASLAAGRLSQALENAMECGAGAANVAGALRRRRSALALALGIGDLAGLLGLDDVVGALSDFADQALQQALEAVVAARTPGEEPRGFAVIALGKLGTRELNYSSDVDLLYLYDPAVLPRRAREEPAQAGVRIGQALTDLIQKRDGEGYVFRVDLRLRPSPEVTPIALPVEEVSVTVWREPED